MSRARATPVVLTDTTIAVSIRAWGSGFTYEATLISSPSSITTGTVAPDLADNAMKNTMIPLVTVLGIILSLSLSGTVVIETVFSLPGMGRLIVNAIQRRDYPVIQGGLLLTATALVMVNLAVDLLYAWLDPRVRYAD